MQPEVERQDRRIDLDRAGPEAFRLGQVPRVPVRERQVVESGGGVRVPGHVVGVHLDRPLVISPALRLRPDEGLAVRVGQALDVCHCAQPRLLRPAGLVQGSVDERQGQMGAREVAVERDRLLQERNRPRPVAAVVDAASPRCTCGAPAAMPSPPGPAGEARGARGAIRRAGVAALRSRGPPHR